MSSGISDFTFASADCDAVAKRIYHRSLISLARLEWETIFQIAYW